MDLRISGELDKDEFIATKKRYKDRQYEILELLQAYDKTDDDFANRLNYMISFASGAIDIFRSSSLEEKRELLKIIYSNQMQHLLYDYVDTIAGLSPGSSGVQAGKTACKIQTAD